MISMLRVLGVHISTPCTQHSCLPRILCCHAFIPRFTCSSLAHHSGVPLAHVLLVCTSVQVSRAVGQYSARQPSQHKAHSVKRWEVWLLDESVPLSLPELLQQLGIANPHAMLPVGAVPND